MLVVVVSDIRFLGHLLIKALGPERGIGVTGALGRLVSSTTTAVSFADRSRQGAVRSGFLAQGIALASCVMLPRALVWASATNPALLRLVLLPVGVMLVVGLSAVFFQKRRGRAKAARPSQGIPLGNPFKLRTAIAVGLLFVLALVVVRAADGFLGCAGVCPASALTASTDVGSIMLSASQVAARGALACQGHDGVVSGVA